jgi:hypothetical protein
MLSLRDPVAACLSSPHFSEIHANQQLLPVSVSADCTNHSWDCSGHCCTPQAHRAATAATAGRPFRSHDHSSSSRLLGSFCSCCCRWCWRCRTPTQHGPRHAAARLCLPSQPLSCQSPALQQQQQQQAATSAPVWPPSAACGGGYPCTRLPAGSSSNSSRSRGCRCRRSSRGWCCWWGVGALRCRPCGLWGLDSSRGGWLHCDR